MDIPFPENELTWINTNPFPVEEINKAQTELHKASQFIMLAGKFLVEHEDDFSHTNMKWDASSESFISSPISNRASIGVRLPSFEIQLLGEEGTPIYSHALHNSSAGDVINWLQASLKNVFVDASDMNIDINYKLPFDFNPSTRFSKPDDDALSHLSQHRTSTNILLNALQKRIDDTSGPATWPHHFDHALHIPIRYDKNGTEIESCNCGYAIADDAINEPYIYVSKWIKDQETPFEDAPELLNGHWSPEAEAAVLRMSELAEQAAQQSIINEFLQRSLKWALNSHHS